MIYLRFGLLFYFMTLPAFVYLSGRFIQPSKWWTAENDDSPGYWDPEVRARVQAKRKTKAGRSLLFYTLTWPFWLVVVVSAVVAATPFMVLWKIYRGLAWVGTRGVDRFINLAPVPPPPPPEPPFVGGYRVPGKWDIDERTVRELEYKAATEAAAANDVSGDGHGPWRPTTHGKTHGGGSR